MTKQQIFPLAGILLLLLLSFWFGAHIESLREMIVSSGWLAPVIYLAIGVIALTLLIPKTIVSLLAGAIFGTWLGVLLMLVIAVLAAAINYSIGRWWFRAAVNNLAQHRDRTNWLPILRLTANEASMRLHVLIRLTPIPTAFISYAMGASGCQLRPFLAGTALAVIPQSLWVHAGTAYQAMDQTSTNHAELLSLGTSVAAAITLSVWLPRIAKSKLQVISVEQAKKTCEPKN